MDNWTQKTDIWSSVKDGVNDNHAITKKKLDTAVVKAKQYILSYVINFRKNMSMDDIIVTNILIQRHGNWFTSFSGHIENEFSNSLEIIFFSDKHHASN